MALILNGTPLHFDFRRAISPAGTSPVVISATDCILLDDEAPPSPVPSNALVLLSPGEQEHQKTWLLRVLGGLEHQDIAGVCLCLPAGVPGKQYEEALSRLSCPVCVIPEAKGPTLLLDACRHLLSGSYTSWCFARFSAQLTASVDGTPDMAISCIALLRDVLGYEAGLYFPNDHFPSLSSALSGSEITAALSDCMSAAPADSVLDFDAPAGQGRAFALKIPNSVGYLVAASDFPAFPEGDSMLLRQCIPKITARMIELMSNRQYLRMDKESFFHDLLFSESVQSAEDITDNARLLNCPMEQRRMVVALQFSEPSAADRFRTNSTVLKFCPFTIDYITLAEHSVIVSVLSGHIPEHIADCKEFLNSFLVRIKQSFFTKDCKIVISMGTICNSLDQLQGSYKVAIALLRIGLIVAPQENIYCLKHYISYYLADFFKENPIFLSLYSTIIDQLRYQDSSNTIHCLSVLAACNFNVQKASAELLLHRNSLYDRLTTIHKHTGLDLKSQESQLLLQMLLRFDELLYSAPPPFQIPEFFTCKPTASHSILWNCELPDIHEEFFPETIEFASRLQALVSSGTSTFEDLLSLTNSYIDHPVDLYSADDYTCFTRHNSLTLLNIGQVLKENGFRLHNAGTFVCFRVQNMNFVAAKVLHGKYPIAFLTINYQQSRDISVRDLQCLECLSPYIAAWLVPKRFCGIASESRVDFYSKLIIGRFQDEFLLQKECSRLGIPIQAQRFIAIVSCAPLSSRQKNHVFSSMKALFHNTVSVFLCGSTSGFMTLLLEASDLSRPIDIQVFLSELYTVIQKNSPDLPVKISVSKPCTHPKRIFDAYKEASFSMTIGTMLSPEAHIYNYNDYTIYHIICTMWGNPIFQYLYQSYITPLLHYDNKYRASLLCALEAYLNSNFSINEASRKSGMHRNCLHKKIAKIQELLQADFSLVQDRIVIQIAVKIYRLQDICSKTGHSLIWAMPLSGEQSSSAVPVEELED